MGEAKRRKQLDPSWSKPKSNVHLLPESMSSETSDQVEQDRLWFAEHPQAREYVRDPSSSELSALKDKGIKDIVSVKVQSIADGVRLRTYISKGS